jgi:hypothetical protein
MATLREHGYQPVINPDDIVAIDPADPADDAVDNPADNPTDNACAPASRRGSRTCPSATRARATADRRSRPRRGLDRSWSGDRSQRRLDDVDVPSPTRSVGSGPDARPGVMVRCVGCVTTGSRRGHGRL